MRQSSAALGAKLGLGTRTTAWGGLTVQEGAGPTMRAKARGDSRSPRRWRELRCAVGKVREVLECGSPLPLWRRSWGEERTPRREVGSRCGMKRDRRRGRKRERTRALQDAAAPAPPEHSTKGGYEFPGQSMETRYLVAYGFNGCCHSVSGISRSPVIRRIRLPFTLRPGWPAAAGGSANAVT